MSSALHMHSSFPRAAGILCAASVVILWGILGSARGALRTGDPLERGSESPEAPRAPTGSAPSPAIGSRLDTMSAGVSLPIPGAVDRRSRLHTEVPAGDVRGVWTSTKSPYFIHGEITVPHNATLTIEPGVEVQFMGHYKLNVQGRLLAIGTEYDTIRFTAADTALGWHGIRFIDTPMTNDTSKIVYCSLKYGKANTGDPTGLDRCGGALMIRGFDKVQVSDCLFESNMTAGDVTTTGGPAICIFGASPIIVHSTFVNNNGVWGSAGAIKCDFASEAIISHNIITNNSSLSGAVLCAYGAMNRPTISCNTISHNVAAYGGGGILVYGGSQARIENNLIVRNHAPFGGGIVCRDAGRPVFLNNTIAHNSSGIFCDGTGDPVFMNNIVWGNGDPQVDQGPAVRPRFLFNDIQGGWPGTGTINLDPRFRDDACRLSDSSECIGTGVDSVEIDTVRIHAPAADGAGSPRPAPPGSPPDLGAWEHPLAIGMGVPQLLFAPATCDFRNVRQGSTSDTINVEILNRGPTRRTITSLTSLKKEFQFAPPPALPFSLDAYASTNPPLKIIFRPTVSGLTVRDTVHIGIADTTVPHTPLFLSGRGSGAVVCARPGALYGVAASSDTVVLYTVDKLTGSAGSRTEISPTPLQRFSALSVRHRDAMLYAAFSGDGETALYRFSSESGDCEPSSRIPLGPVTAMAFSADDRLYMVTSQGRMYRVCDALADSVHTDTVFVGSTGHALTGLAFSPATRVLWASIHDTVFTVDTGTGIATMVGSTGGDPRRSSLAFDALGVLYGLYGSCLAIVGKVWGEANVIGLVGVPDVTAIAMRCDIPTEVHQDAMPTGLTWELEQNYPNPFNPRSAIRYQVPEHIHVRLVVHDLLGREVAVLVDEVKGAGSHETLFDGGALASGVYIYRLTAGSWAQSRSMILIR